MRLVLNDKPQIIFTYGFTASGKTTWCKNFLEEENQKILKRDWVYISADEIREEMYGSQDCYGVPFNIYKKILSRMLDAIKEKKNILYDACNLRKGYRMDYLRYFKDNEDYYKTIVRINTDFETCNQRHKERGRNFDFDLSQNNKNYPTLEEGWDNIVDFSFSSNHSFYIASPFFEEIHRERAYKVAEFLRNKGYMVFLPCEHKVPDAWEFPNYEWGEQVFVQDIQGLESSEYLICLSYGRMGSAGTAWELGYAFGKGIKTIVVQMPEVNLMSLMVSNGCHTVFKNLEEFYKCNFDKFYLSMGKIDKTMEQK